MQNRKHFFIFLSIIFLFISPLISRAQQGNEPSPTLVTVEPAPAKAPVEFLSDKLANLPATTESKAYQPENLSELTGDKSAIFQDYKVRLAASRTYGTAQVNVFLTESRFAAYGLFHYLTAQANAQPAAKSIGAESAIVDGSTIFWKSQYFVIVNGTPALAAAIAEKLPASENAAPPKLFESLPATGKVAHSERYFLGAQTLNTYLPHASDIFTFDGDAEAAYAEYHKTAGVKNHASQDPAATFKLAIVEYHTPQFATAALKRSEEFLQTLAPEEQQRLVIKRVGNFIVEAANVEDRNYAEKLIGAIEYPYVVKMLKDPSLPYNDPRHNQKAAEVILSSFAIIGVTGVAAIFCGSLLGTIIFLKRRKRQQQVFSDAGGMLRLQLDPIEDVILLPPGKGE